MSCGYCRGLKWRDLFISAEQEVLEIGEYDMLAFCQKLEGVQGPF